MKVRLNDRPKFKIKLDDLQERLAVARSESSRVAASRPTTARKLADIGRHLVRLEAELAEIAEEKARTKR